MNVFKFYLSSTIVFLLTSVIGFFTGAKIISEFLVVRFGEPHGEEILSYSIYSMIFSIFTSLLGIIVGFIIIHKLGKRWGGQLNFGSHPVLKLTFLSFLTFLGLLFLLLLFYPSK